MKSSVTFIGEHICASLLQKNSLIQTMLVLNQLKTNSDIPKLGDQFETAKTSLGEFNQLFSTGQYSLILSDFV